MNPPRPRLGPRTRAALVLAAVALAAPLGLARLLEPDPRGFGTHQRLGLPPRGARLATAAACPSCGMTTSLALATRGQLAACWRAHPAGPLLAPATAAMAGWLLSCAASGRPRGSRSVAGPIAGAAVLASAATRAAWWLRTYWTR
ncbi:DUF2752 domain-containing protein [Tautonia sociabilis]|uniref:DUF2752 domain-containing protein n=1 Tax=Tautonia sociabilis TaxID=2080755 RepID=A0A432MCA4_9BACT|nr:DUF2752 domain-containing protein [Tautonia sociabilis]RUL81614.1 DUF2752 domain-containing protein [Tautonia sociabilis]